MPSGSRGRTPEKPITRPKIGVALSGGAALGLAHIGVLEWLEEHRIPVDYIAGTSMGGLVAALHATGMNASEMREFADGVDWSAALSTTTPYRQLAFRRKEDVAEFPVTLEVGMKARESRLTLRLIGGPRRRARARQSCSALRPIKSFNDLPTPFRCVASDLNSGKGVIFKTGRCSMLYAPPCRFQRFLRP